jgi:bisanhydrobacterioruberin hydratase
MRKISYKNFIISLIIFYSVGVAGITISETHEIFRNLISAALILNAILLSFYHHPRINVRTIGVFLFIAFFSFFVEAAGVKTGKIFGSYSYGDSLGPKILETPVLIGLNWLMLVYCSKVASDFLSKNNTARIIISPFLMVVYDLVLEQCAPPLGMWYWSGSGVPALNYLAWFSLALFFHLIIKHYKISFSNKMAIPILVIQFLFFVVLWINFLLTG